MRELYQNLKFFENPFSRFNAEEELQYMDSIYFEPKYFKTLYDDIRNNNSRFIFGQRGSGKSALMYTILSKLRKEKNLFILVDEFDFLSESTQTKEFQIVFIKQFLKILVTKIFEGEAITTDLSKAEKEKLQFIISHFFDTVSKSEFEKIYKFCEASKAKNILVKLLNKIFSRIINNILSGAVLLTSDVVSKSLGLPKIDDYKFYREYIPELRNGQISEINKDSFRDLVTPEKVNEIFDDLISITKKLDYSTIVIFLDKVDETAKIKGNVDLISQSLIPLLSENRLILRPDVGIVLMLWSKLKYELNRKGVRFDKIKPVDISWNKQDLKLIMEKRLKYFSENKINQFGQIFEKQEDMETVLILADGSPRDLLHVLHHVYNEQQEIDSNSSVLKSVAVIRGINKFLQTYDFYALYPAQRSVKEDIKHIIAKLTNLGKLSFQGSDVAAILKIQSQAANSYIKIWKNYGIVIEIKEKAGMAKFYKLDDPKIEYIVRDQIKLN